MKGPWRVQGPIPIKRLIRLRRLVRQHQVLEGWPVELHWPPRRRLRNVPACFVSLLYNVLTGNEVGLIGIASNVERLMALNLSQHILINYVKGNKFLQLVMKINLFLFWSRSHCGLYFNYNIKRWWPFEKDYKINFELICQVYIDFKKSLPR